MIGTSFHYNRNFEKGEVFEKEATHGDYISLTNSEYRVWVHKDRITECFELVWKDTGIFKKSLYFKENDDES